MHDLLSGFYYKDLCGLSETVRKTEEDFVQFITSTLGNSIENKQEKVDFQK